MRAADFDYALPDALIAQHPPLTRRASRLLSLAADGGLADRVFGDLPGLLRAGDLLVLNDTRVIPARLYARKGTGGQVEILIERSLGEGRVLAHARASKPLRAETSLEFPDGTSCVVRGRASDLFELDFGSEARLRSTLDACGHVPLPPYIRRPDEALDRERYQTVFARRPGAVAAPTAGLHFDQPMLDELVRAGVRLAWLTLHVGAGTFQPLRGDDVAAHHLHAERVTVPTDTVTAVTRTRAAGGRVVAVGTTVVRALETAAAGGALAGFEGDTTLFIKPGYRFRVVDAMLTNFHLPRSTLLMLVCAFAGHGAVMGAYAHAVADGYRFYSYGDAMFIDASPERG